MKPLSLTLAAGLLMAALTLSAQNAPTESAPLNLGSIGSLSLPGIHFSGASVAEAINFVDVKAKELDPQKKGLTFLVDDATRALQTPLTLEVKNVTVADAVRYVALMARLEVVVLGDAVQLKHSAAVHPPFPSSKSSPRVAKFGTLVFPKVQFSEARLDEAVEFFRVKGRQFDPANGDVPIIIDPELLGRQQATVTLNLSEVPLAKALSYCALLANAEVVCLGDALYVQPRKQ